MTRREFVSRTAAASAAVTTLNGQQAGQKPEPQPLPLRIGMTDWNLGRRGDITKIALAREIGLDGIQVSITYPTDGSPHLGQLETQAAFKRAALENGIQICSLAIGNPGKHRLPMHTNPAFAILLIEAVEVARNLGTNNILLPILGAGDRGAGRAPLWRVGERVEMRVRRACQLARDPRQPVARLGIRSGEGHLEGARAGLGPDGMFDAS